MKVLVVGKEHRSGVSKKNGNPYDCTVAHIQYKRNKVEGMATEMVWLDTGAFAPDTIVVGKQYNLERDGGGYIVAFEQV